MAKKKVTGTDHRDWGNYNYKPVIVKNSGVQGDYALIQPERVSSMLSTDELIQKAEVLDVGPNSPCSIGDVVIVKDWLIERIRIGDNTTYYAPASSILHIL